jgi:hypothetical protein
MSQQHPTPWRTDEHIACTVIDANNHSVSMPLGANKQEISRRIVACVNRLAGHSTEDIENPATDLLGHHILVKRITAAEGQRNELLAALKGLHSVCALALTGESGLQYANFETRSGHFVDASVAMSAAEAAIVKAEAV